MCPRGLRESPAWATDGLCMCKTALIVLAVTVLGCGGTGEPADDLSRGEIGDLGVPASDQSPSGAEDMAEGLPDLSTSNPDDLATASPDLATPAEDLATPAEDLAMAAEDLAMAAQDLAGTVTQPLPSTTGDGTFTISGRSENAIRVVVPSPKPAHPPLVIAFHATGGEPSGAISDSQLSVNAAKYGLVAIAPRAGYRSGSHPGDVDHEPNSSGSSWNMWDPDPNTNDDLRYVQALIAAAKTTWDVDTTRVYTVGFSNG
ncbi:MAG TPA: hypothetical protein VMZ28_27190, partial [Kofleriaceae bacterium]|nr:hypothetical protein [Kofleriaceae bacterium]